MIRRLKRLFVVSFPFDPLTADQVKTLKGALHREVVVKRRPATTASVPANRPLLPGAVALDVLDSRQEQAARSIGSGHQVIFGIAGSGKSVLLTSRARLIATHEPAKKVLILCYNKVLAASTAAQLAADPALRTDRGPELSLLGCSQVGPVEEGRRVVRELREADRGNPA